VQAANYNRLLAEGWVLLGVYPLARVGEMAQGESSVEEQQKQTQDTQRYVWRFIKFVVGRKRE
jgi:hypothetical protein